MNTNDFAIAFDEVTSFLRSLGIEPVIKKSATATSKDLARFQRATGIELLLSFAGFFTTFANGYEFSWHGGDECGAFSMPSLEKLAKMRSKWMAHVIKFGENPRSMDQCIAPEHRDAAFRIWRRMRSWIPFMEELEGDAFCVDSASGRIVFNKHDWFDGFGEVAETNGLIAGWSLIDFIQIWGRFSFIPQWFTDAPHPATKACLDWIAGGSPYERMK